ncbi:hypothetical protein Y032_0031g2293 [Ancylostoma ceylanicum]|uniref:Uncharacterized protein n=1 Tax=Ancylostoma ceylanicum TaxID=53326 RepID=A0A016URK6_9BILA|nr:hypothetical protein Y032_0031g2293 [Ancylostoma ceylanicum]
MDNPGTLLCAPDLEQKCLYPLDLEQFRLSGSSSLASTIASQAGDAAAGNNGAGRPIRVSESLNLTKLVVFLLYDLIFTTNDQSENFVALTLDTLTKRSIIISDLRVTVNIIISSEKAKRLNVILSRLPKDLQVSLMLRSSKKKYKDEVNKTKQQMKKHLELQKAAAKKWGYAQLLSKVEAIDTDMSISDSQADNLEQKVRQWVT